MQSAHGSHLLLATGFILYVSCFRVLAHCKLLRTLLCSQEELRQAPAFGGPKPGGVAGSVAPAATTSFK